MKPILVSFARGFAVVMLTAANVLQIAGHHYGGAFVLAMLISWVWWMNSRSAAHGTTRWAREAYAFGAGLGTVFGMWCVSTFYR